MNADVLGRWTFELKTTAEQMRVLGLPGRAEVVSEIADVTRAYLREKELEERAEGL